MESNSNKTEVLPVETKVSQYTVPFSKSVQGLNTTPTRSFAFETKKQRNARFIEKGISKPGGISYDTLRRAAKSVAVIGIAVTVLKEKVTKTKWIIKPTDPLADKDQAKIDEVTELFKHPNRNNETFRSLADKMIEDLLVLDAVSLEKTRYSDGKLAELFFVDSETIRPVFDVHGNQDVEIPINTKDKGQEILPVSYVQVFDSTPYGGADSGEIIAAWPKRDFTHFHMHPQGNMEYFGYGLSPVERVIGAVANLLNADNYNSSYFDEGFFPPIILQMVGQMNENDIEKVKEYLYAEMSGSAHRPMIMAGPAKAEAINLKNNNNNDMQFMEYFKFMARLVAASFGLSGQDIGLTEDVGSKNVSETMKSLTEEKGYGSILHLLKEVFNQEIIWKDFGYTDLEFDWVVDDTMDPNDISTVVDSSLKNGTRTINESRHLMGLLPYGEWADRPMLLTSSGTYMPLVPDDAIRSGLADAKIGGENSYKDQDEQIAKSVMVLNTTYKTWVDDRGYSQPFIWIDIMTGTGLVVKPPVAVNMMSQKLEVELSQELTSRGLNVPLVTKVDYTAVVSSLPFDIQNEFNNYCNLTSNYDSEKWRAKFGGSRKFDYYLVSSYVDGFSLENKILFNDMKREPKSYATAIKDLAQLWLAEKELVLGDRRVNQYIITHDKRGFGIDYQFKGNENRYKDTQMEVAEYLQDIPYLYNLYMTEIGKKPKNILDKIKDKFASKGIKLAKSSNVQQPSSVADMSNEFKDCPVLFGELLKDEKTRSDIKDIFKLQNEKAMNRFRLTELAFMYDYNQALTSLKEFVTANPESFGGIITSKDERGVRYSVFAKK